MTPTTELSRADEPDLEMGEKLFREMRSAMALWHAKPSSETFAASSDAAAEWDDWAVNNLPALLATARRVAEMEGENKRLKGTLEYIAAQAKAAQPGALKVIAQNASVALSGYMDKVRELFATEPALAPSEQPKEVG